MSFEIIVCPSVLQLFHVTAFSKLVDFVLFFVSLNKGHSMYMYLYKKIRGCHE